MTDYKDLIELLVRCLNVKSYLELGISSGVVFSRIIKIVPFCIGIDIRDVRDKSIEQYQNFIKTTTDDFFTKNKATFDLIFIDADHSINQVKKDLDNSIKILNKSGTILLHDTDPVNDEFTAKNKCNDSYKIIEYIKANDALESITLPIGVQGITIVRRKDDRRVLDFKSG